MSLTSQNVRFGVEIECAIPTAYADIFVPGRYHDGNPLIGEGLTGWNCQKDGSVQAPDGFVAVEVVSGVLSGEDGLIQVVAVVDQLKALGAKVNTSTGLHIHIDGRHIPESRIPALVANYRKYEKLLYGINGSCANERWTSTYARNSSMWDQFNQDHERRYRGLNLTNYQKYNQKKTVEFRMFRGTLDAEKVIGIIYVLTALVVRTVNEGKFADNAGETAVSQFHTFGKTFVGTEYRIVQDAPVWDVLLPLGKMVKKSTI